jgi:hypothetical protein
MFVVPRYAGAAMLKGIQKYIIVALVVIGMMFAVAIAQSTHPVAPPSNSAPNGRYQIIFSPLARADVYLLDTETGKVWHPVTITNVKGDPEIWLPEDRMDSQEAYAKWSLEQVYKETTITPNGATR